MTAPKEVPSSANVKSYTYVRSKPAFGKAYQVCLCMYALDGQSYQPSSIVTAFSRQVSEVMKLCWLQYFYAPATKVVTCRLFEHIRFRGKS